MLVFLKPEKGIDSLGPGVADGCEPADRDAGNQTQVLRKSRMCSEQHH